jgi:hypothetical protein
MDTIGFKGVLLLGIGLAGLLAGCSDKGGGVEPDPEYTITFVAAEEETSQNLSGVDFNSTQKSKQNAASISVTATSGTNVTMTADKDGYLSGSESETITQGNDGRTVAIALRKDNPETVVVSYEIRTSGSDTLAVGDVYNQETGETLASGAASGTIPLPFSDEATTLCAAPQYFAEGCVEVTPDADKSRTIRITRESVEISFTVNDKSGNSVEDPEIVVEAGQGEMYTYSSGERTHAFGARAGSRGVSVAAEGFITSERTLAAAESHDLSVELERKEKQPACSDGIDNDGDGLIDEADGGCVANDSPTPDPTDPDWVYDPEDESEEFRVVGNDLGFSSSRSALVSSKEGERTRGLFGNNFPETIRFAVGKIEFYLGNSIKENQSGEAFAIRFQCGPENESREDHSNIIVSDIVPDDQSIDGRRESPVHGFTREILQNGTDCGFFAVHATEVRDEPFGDGNDDVVFYTPNEDASFRYRYGYEPEDAQ